MDKAKTSSQPTIRFSLNLAQPTDDQYNEFSYAKLVNDAVKKVKAVYYKSVIVVGCFHNQGWFFEG